jgi:hypothetical protein
MEATKGKKSQALDRSRKSRFGDPLLGIFERWVHLPSDGK